MRNNIAARRRPRTLGRLSLAVAAAVVASVVAPFVGSTHGFATTLEQKRAEARHIAEQIDANNERISILDEQYNGAVLRIAKLTKNIKDAQAALAVARHNADGLRAQVRSRAAELYMGARSGTLFLELDAQNA
jgi:hypothetical protein